jgi:hypothetical protein
MKLSMHFEERFVHFVFDRSLTKILINWISEQCSPQLMITLWFRTTIFNERTT